MPLLAANITILTQDDSATEKAQRDQENIGIHTTGRPTSEQTCAECPDVEVNERLHHYLERNKRYEAVAKLSSFTEGSQADQSTSQQESCSMGDTGNSVSAFHFFQITPG